jgi:serine/threonine protein kinase
VQKKGETKLLAMKVLSKDKILGKNLVRYAMTERNVLSAMNHPFIVKLNYAFQNDTKLFLVMDYCPGGDLGKLLSKKKALS